MGNAVRLNNGTAVQVRLGVLQGIGPVGAQGRQGIQGPVGDTGAQGQTGATGAISAYLGQAQIGTANTLAVNTDQQVSFDTLLADDYLAYTATAWTLTEPGDYDIKAWLSISKPTATATGSRSMWINVNGVIVSLVRVAANPLLETALSTSWVYRNIGTAVVKVYMRSTDTLTSLVSTGAISINRIGAGPIGVQGVQGPMGPVGSTGATGPQGPTGSAGTGYATYGDVSS